MVSDVSVTFSVLLSSSRSRPPSPRRLSRMTRGQMKSDSTNNCSYQAAIRGHRHFSYGGAVVPENVSIKQYYDITSTKKSNVRLNDQLIPKPTDINIAERTIKVATTKAHPYSSHIPRFAMFPSFDSPDDPDTGVRAASQPILNALIPASASQVTVLSKPAGGPYRHEILKSPVTARKKAVVWTGEHGFLDHTKPVKGAGQVFYPTPPKTVLPNPKTRGWDISLSERTTNMLRNVARSQWVTSYQMHYTGSGPANPLKMDDFKEKLIDLASGRMTSHTAQLRERSYPAFVPSEPREGRKASRRQGRRAVKSSYRPPAECSDTEPGEPRSPSPVQNPGHAPGSNLDVAASVQERRPQQVTARGHSRTEFSSIVTENGPGESSQEKLQSPQADSRMLKNQQPDYVGIQCEITEKEDGQVQFDKGEIEVLMPQSNQETNAVQATEAKITDMEHSLYSRPLSQVQTEVSKEKSLIELCYKDVDRGERQDLKVKCNPFSIGKSAFAKEQRAVESDTEVSSRTALEKEKLQKGIEMPRSISNPRIRPRPSVLPRVHPVGRAVSVGEQEAAVSHHFSSLRELQDSFSKSEVHHNFNGSVSAATVDPRDNVCTGKKHNFYGINCYYLHG
ncbi:sperm-associated microtubule inner protein 4 [Polymixia lowei]